MDRRPIAMIIVANGNWNSLKRPELNLWGYANWLRTADPVGAILTAIGQALAMGFHVAVKGLNGTGPGQDVTAAYLAMEPTIRAQWEARFPEARRAWLARYPRQRVGHYTGSKWGTKGPASLTCEGDAALGVYTCDTRDDAAQANFRAAYGAFIEQGADILIVDKGSHFTRIEGTRAAAKFCTGLDAVHGRDVAVISEAVRDGADELAMVARTEFVHKFGLAPADQEGATHGPLWDKVWPEGVANRYWWMQLDYGVPAAGPEAEAFIRAKADQGWIPCVQWPQLAAEVAAVAASHPKLEL